MKPDFLLLIGRQLTKIHAWAIPALLLCFGLLLAACNSPSQPPEPPAEQVQRTKPPFEPLNPTKTAEFQQTATAVVQATASAYARLEQINAYQFYDPFDGNDFDWRETVEDNRYWQGAIAIQDGRYIWQVEEVYENFLAWSFFTPDENLADFDVALKARRVSGPPNETCYGLLFRISPDGYTAGAYVLSVCDNGYHKLLYTDEAVGWVVIYDWTFAEVILQEDWNLIEINARGEDFTVSINHQQVAAFSDGRLPNGSVAILIDIYENQPAQIEFDFFALQPR